MDTGLSEVVVGVDWGTTHRRAYALDGNGALVANYSDSEGALACKGRFGPALDLALAQLQVRPGLVLLSGMVGSTLGWLEVPYVGSEVSLFQLPEFVVPAPSATGTPPGFIVPGYCIRNQQGQPDVMRGEETQLLGAAALGHGDGWFVLPGTHSKWVQLQAGRILQLRTYMTGELFNLLSNHGTLASAASAGPVTWSDEAFAQGVNQSGASSLSHQLFGARARVVSGDMPAANTHSYMSGLLIGAELRDVMRMRGQMTSDARFKLIGTPDLARHYEAAATLLDLSFEILDAQGAYLAALHYIRKQKASL